MRWLLIAVFLALSMAPRPARAHAIIMSSSPAVDETVTGPDVPVKLRYNSRIDRDRSIITLIGPEDSNGGLSASRQDLRISTTSTADTLIAQIDHLDLPAPGHYRLRWQVLSVDGHITRGDIPFDYLPGGLLGGPVPVPSK